MIWTRNRYQVNLRFKSDVPYTLNDILLNSNQILLNYIPTWVLIKIKVSGAATIAVQPRINRDPNGVNRGRVLSYATLFCAENRQNIATYHSIYRHGVSQGPVRRV